MTNPTAPAATEPDLDLTREDIEQIVARYVAVWSEPDAGRRRNAIADLWALDGVEIVETRQFRGHEELAARVTEAYEMFVGSGTFTVTLADDPYDVTGHHDVITCTVQLTAPTGDVAWAARVFLMLGEDGLIERDYQFTVKPLESQ